MSVVQYVAEDMPADLRVGLAPYHRVVGLRADGSQEWVADCANEDDARFLAVAKQLRLTGVIRESGSDSNVLECENADGVEPGSSDVSVDDAHAEGRGSADG